MHRQDARTLLQNHRKLVEATPEARTVDQILAFMDSHVDCFHRSCLDGHLTSSAWITNAQGTRVLLTHHRKLDKWLQLGGHADGDTDLVAVALREAREESGLRHLELRTETLFDVDCHRIPERKGVPEHWHHDCRFWIIADETEPLVLSDESHDLAWVGIEEVATLNPEESMLRMVRKTLCVMGV